MELPYNCDLKGEWFDFIYTFSQLLPGLVAGVLVRYVLCGVALSNPLDEWREDSVGTFGGDRHVTGASGNDKEIYKYYFSCYFYGTQGVYVTLVIKSRIINTVPFLSMLIIRDENQKFEEIH